MTIWGFTYKSVGFVWAKRTPRDTGWHMGCGYGTRANAEYCLLGTRGRPKRLARDVRQLVVAPRREHSRKPDEIAAAIERLFPGARLEMFARTARPGWDAWGVQAGLLDSGAAPKRRWRSDGHPDLCRPPEMPA